MSECSVCKRVAENLSNDIKMVWCESAKAKICKDCCIKNKGHKCYWWTLCWYNSA